LGLLRSIHAKFICGAAFNKGDGFSSLVQSDTMAYWIKILGKPESKFSTPKES